MQRAAGGRHGRDVENMRVRNNPVNNHSDPIRNNGALGFFEEVSNKKKNNNNKMSSDMRSVPDLGLTETDTADIVSK